MYNNYVSPEFFPGADAISIVSHPPELNRVLLSG